MKGSNGANNNQDVILFPFLFPKTNKKYNC